MEPCLPISIQPRTGCILSFSACVCLPSGPVSLRENLLKRFPLEQSRYLAGVNVHIHPAVGWIRTGSRHQADGTAAGAEELGAREDEHILNGESPPLGYTLHRRIVGEGEMGLHHHGGEVIVLGITLEHFGLGFGRRSPGHAIGSIDVLGDEFNPITQLRL